MSGAISTYRITEYLFGRDPYRPSDSNLQRASYSQFPRTMSRQLLKISLNGESTNSLGNLLHYSFTLIAKIVFPDAQKEPPVFELVPTASGPIIGRILALWYC